MAFELLEVTTMISRRAVVASWAGFVRVLRAAAQGRGDVVFRDQAGLVIVPTTVADARGRLVRGLGASDFRLYDEGTEQQVAVDHEPMPVSLVVALHATVEARKPLWALRQAASLFGPLVVGEGGEAALAAIRDSVDVAIPFTSDFGKFTKGVRELEARGSGCRFIDAVAASGRLLSTRPRNRRKVIVVMAESRDSSSEEDLRQTLVSLQRENVTVYALTYSPGVMAFGRERPVGP